MRRMEPTDVVRECSVSRLLGGVYWHLCNSTRHRRSRYAEKGAHRPCWECLVSCWAVLVDTRFEEKILAVALVGVEATAVALRVMKWW